MSGDESALAQITGREGLLDAEPLALPEPALGADRTRHSSEFAALDRAFDGVRDIVNRGIGVLNDLGFSIRRLPEESLQELLVLPLTGDYRRIRQNAEALGHVDNALAIHASNTVRLALATDPRWGGDAAGAYLVRLGRHAAAARGSGELLALAAPVFGEIADFSEAVAVETEELVVELVDKGERLMRRLLSRISGPLGWGIFAAEVAIKGTDAVTDLVNDAKRLIDIIDRLDEMKGEVEAWVDEQRERLELLREIGDVARAELRAV